MLSALLTVAGGGARARTGGWGFLYLAVGTGRRAPDVYTFTRARRGCIMHVCGDGREFKLTPASRPPPPRARLVLARVAPLFSTRDPRALPAPQQQPPPRALSL